MIGAGPEIAILGPLEVRRDGFPIPIARAKQRALLALLATEAGRTVSVDRMVDELWGDEPPARATASLQAYVSNLRKLLEPDRPKGSPATVLVTEPPGYRLDLPDGSVDASRFEALTSAGRAALDAGAVGRRARHDHPGPRPVARGRARGVPARDLRAWRPWRASRSSDGPARRTA